MLEADKPLAPFTTLGVGGLAHRFLSCPDEVTLRRGLQIAADEGWPCLLLGGGSNMLIADRGFAGLVIRLVPAGLAVRTSERLLSIEAAAGCEWDRLVASSVAAGSAALAPLSGIPGSCGAAPIQNIGAYGVELSEHLVSIDALDRTTLQRVRLAASELQLGYRSSSLKRDRGQRFVVLAIRLQIPLDAELAIGYEELRRRLHDSATAPTPASLRELVLCIRGEKSMLLDARDANSRSAGSFFTNPVVTSAEADAIAARCTGPMPRWPTAEGRVKLSAAWCIEQAGFRRGEQRGRAAISQRHVLALCNPSGEASAAEILTLAREIHVRVRERLGVRLVPEACLIGFSSEELGPFGTDTDGAATLSH